MIEFEVKGLRELDEALKRLPLEIQRKVLARAVLAGAGVIRDEARRLCPKNTGALAKSIVAKRKRQAGASVVYQVGPRKFYGHMVEFGTAPHEIKMQKLGKMLKLGRWRNIYAASVEHPGTAPRPFLRPAFDTSIDKATERFRMVLARAIERGEVVYWKRTKGW